MCWSKQTTFSKNPRDNYTKGHHQIVNTEIRLCFLQPKIEKLYTVSKNKSWRWLWFRSWAPYWKIQVKIEQGRKNHYHHSSAGKEFACNVGGWVQFLAWDDPLEKGKATHTSILAWRIPWTEHSRRAQRVGHDSVTFDSLQEKPLGHLSML